MQELRKSRSQKAGLPPGTLMHIGEKKTEKTRITDFYYSEDELNISETSDIDVCLKNRRHLPHRWINVEGIDDVTLLEKLGKHFGLHPLIMEDILTTDQRPKVEFYNNYVCIIIRMLYFNKQSWESSYEQISIVLGEGYVISFTESQTGLFKPIYDRIKNDSDRIRKMGIDYLAYTVLDFIVDNYFNVLEILDEKIETLEEKLVMKPTDDYLKTIHRLKRQVLLMHRSIWPLREVIASLGRGETQLFSQPTFIYIRDLHDHVIHALDMIDTMRDILASLLDIYLSSVSKKMNEVMKVLTIISTIFIPLTFLVGVYGMNFKHMPELDLWWAYPALWVGMIGLVVAMIFIFKKKKWL